MYARNQYTLHFLRRYYNPRMKLYFYFQFLHMKSVMILFTVIWQVTA